MRSAEATPGKTAPAEGGGGAPVLAIFGGIIALSIAAFSANAKNAADFKAAEEARKAAEAKALQGEYLPGNAGGARGGGVKSLNLNL